MSILLAGLLAACVTQAQAPSRAAGPQPLWPQGAPGAVGREPADTPTWELFVPPPGRANGAAMVVLPGGAYVEYGEDEAAPVARWLNSLGVTAMVVRYRLGPRYHHPAMLQDAQRGLRLFRARAAEWGIDPHRVGIIGFSAGGHLASTVATHFDPGDERAPDSVQRQSSRPDLVVLCYPVITMQRPLTHAVSRTSLLGEHPDPALEASLSNETQVTATTPPAFLFHTADDNVVPVENSLRFAEACRRAGVPVELHVFEHGPHGVGLATGSSSLRAWTALCETWMRERGFLRR